ncbi:hypothetical protein Tco_1118569 [Tanacetum coccineum]
MAEQDIPPPTITAMKIPIIRKGEYDIWSMRMRQYICHTDHNLWDVIVNGDLEEEPAPTGETSAPPAPKTAKQLAAKRNQERVKSILLLAIPDEYLFKFHNVADAKSHWAAIKSRYGLPPSWNKIALIMRNKPDIDEIDIDRPLNNLRVYLREKNEKVLQGADISFACLDEYAIRKKIIESKTTDLNTKTSETVGKTNEANTQKPKTVYESVNRDKVIIEDWNSDDEDDVSEVQTVSPVKTNETQTVKTRVDKIGQTSQKQGIGFKKIKACFVCKSTDHLIKDCNFHDKQSQEPKLKTVVQYGPSVDKQNDDNTKRVNHQKISKYPHLRKTFVPSGVLKRTGLITPVKQNEKRVVHKVSTARPVLVRKACKPRGSYSPIKRSYYTKPAFRPKDLKQDVKTFGVQNMTTAGTRAVVNTGKGKMDTDLKKSRWVWRPKGNYLDHVSKDSGSFMLKKGNPEILLQDHAVVDSGCSSHMTGNKAYLSDYEDFNGGFVAFGSDPKGGKITVLDESQLYVELLERMIVYPLGLKEYCSHLRYGYCKNLKKDGQDRTNTDTGKEREYKSRENAIMVKREKNSFNWSSSSPFYLKLKSMGKSKLAMWLVNSSDKIQGQGFMGASTNLQGLEASPDSYK